GYANGEGMNSLTIQVNSGGLNNTTVAFKLRQQLQNVLGINTEVEVLSFNKLLENAKKGDFDIIRLGWIADHPHPQSFLKLAYSRSVPESKNAISWPNISRYENKEFDKWYEKGLHTMNKKESYKYFKKAEKILVEDVPMLSLWYNETHHLSHSHVRNYHTNPLRLIKLDKVYFKERTKKKGSN
ncbi:MAG: ABC transporter substrate-binding protein, partial [Flavobacteriales bacterium]